MLRVNFMYNGYCFVLNDKHVSELEVKESGYTMTDEDEAAIRADFTTACKEHKGYEQNFGVGINLQLDRIRK
jgi:hypothetical protein